MATFVINTKNSAGAIHSGHLAAAQPGDTILIDAAAVSPVSYIYLGVANNPNGAPIVVKNINGQVQLTAGFSWSNSKGILVDGTGDPAHEYGFRVNSNKPLDQYVQGSGINVDGYAKNVEIKNVWIDNIGCGLWCKNEPSCDAALNAHVIENVNIHHSKFTNIRIEGTYIGSTNVVKNGANVRSLSCNGVAQTIYPPQVGNIKINDNIFDSSGRAAIQMSQASVGLSEIKRNIVRNVGREYSDAQGNGINIGGDSKVIIEGNDISDTYVAGICSFGAFTVIRNNIINNSGRLDGRYVPWVWGIWCEAKAAEPNEPQEVFIIGNQIGARGMGSGSTASTQTDAWWDICVMDSFAPAGTMWKTTNIIRDNTSSVTGLAAKLDIEAGIQYATVGDPPVGPAAPLPNLAPTAVAGVDKTITLPTDTVQLVGSGADPENGPLTYAWSKVSGGAATIATPNAATTNVTGLAAGTYVFRLRATDASGKFGEDDVSVLVNPAPVVDPGGGTGGGGGVVNPGGTPVPKKLIAIVNVYSDGTATVSRKV